jgi:predicted alpha/beta superfamily hydrolase
VTPAAPAPDPVLPHQTFTIDSRALGETRLINLYTPPGYDQAAGAGYPVLYVPDGGVAEDFPHVTSDIDAAIRAGEMSPVIVVGIENTERRRDMTGPTDVAKDREIAPRVGGSAAFRAFLRDELMPEIARRYRTTGETAIVGESLAGLFVVETFVLEPALFDTYIAFDPSLWWNGRRLLGQAKVALAAAPKLDNTLYLASSDEPDLAETAALLAGQLSEAGLAGLRLHYAAMPEETHGTIYHPAALRAFRLLFAPPPVPAAPPVQETSP